MPTPFTHLAVAQKLLKDEIIPQEIRDDLEVELPAFLLGNIAADARINMGGGREATHFYTYSDTIQEHPWRIMLTQNPILKHSQDSAHRAFLAGYVAHLAIDEAWHTEFTYPNFFLAKWGEDHRYVFTALHLVLIYMDSRDYNLLEAWQPETLLGANPENWLPFMPDDVLSGWRDFIGEQIATENGSQTLQVFGSRIKISPEELHKMSTTDEIMQTRLWQHIPQETLHEAEQKMYTFCREQLQIYMGEFQ